MTIQPETIKIAHPFDGILKARGWTYHNIHGNEYQMGLPDRFIHHPKYSSRWIEYKVVRSGSVKLTQAQKAIFPQMISNNVPIYIIAHTDLRYSTHELKRMYNKLFEEPNAVFALNKKTMHMLF